ncbi:uncharacterized protein ATNIH1004_002174 [Aspergillus tanneri]|uniref:Uncharacterized protein n=1 Tax=Aspergillus tanneri TaxID=1220188 RepID=A0A5M9MX67_9EURO|nr:uncharacterized protein ATNIH1004_002174 [Aspergillus tanneri]KAA8649503.1 hypothetical protein ATNIH1004_002174 [Aspergillus tanneri]
MEKSDSIKVDNILKPVFFLLAARRGVHNDVNFVDSDYVMRYQGKSGVDAINRTPFWRRFVWGVGTVPNNSIWPEVFFVFIFVTLICRYIDYRSGGVEYFNARLWQQFSIAGLASLVVIVLFIAARRYAKYKAATVTPSEFNPTSYQYRLVNAMKLRGLQYREIVTATPTEIHCHWKENYALCERFHNEGLVDPYDSRSVYDISVRFYSNGVVYLEFPTDETSKPRPGVVTSLNP